MCCIRVIFQLGGVGARVTLLRPRVVKVEGVWKVGVVPPCKRAVSLYLGYGSVALVAQDS